jgi:hypothetical protein
MLVSTNVAPSATSASETVCVDLVSLPRPAAARLRVRHQLAGPPLSIFVALLPGDERVELSRHECADRCAPLGRDHSCSTDDVSVELKHFDGPTGRLMGTGLTDVMCYR